MQSKTIIYDDSCPLCAAYTNVFIKTGFLDSAGRKNFSQISPELAQLIDIKRAVNEIPLIDPANHQVWYGVDALLEILQQKIPFTKTIGNFQPLKWILQKTYKLISYNRRVIVAGSNMPGTFDCTPDFNARYRILFIALLFCLNMLLISPVQQYVLNNSLFKATSALQVQLIFLAVFISHALLVCRLTTKKIVDLLAQISLLTAILLLLTLPLVWMNQQLSWSAATAANNFYLGVLTVFTIKEYFRRMSFIGFIRNHERIIKASCCCIAASIVYFFI